MEADENKEVNLKIDGTQLYGKKDLTVEEMDGLIRNISKINKEQKVIKISLENINVPEGYDISAVLNQIGKNVNNIQIKNCTLNNLDSLMQGISGKEDSTNDFLKVSNQITEFGYNKEEKTMNLSADKTDLMRDFSEYIKPEKLNLKMYGEEDKLTLANNMRAIQEAKFTDIRVEDATKDKHLTEMGKYESYANGNITMFQSKVLKETLGFDRLPTNNTGMRYNIKIDGQTLVEKGLYKLEGEEAKAFLTDLRELSRSIDVSGISLKNIELPQSPAMEEALTEIFGKVERIQIENTNIPNLQNTLSNIKNKENLETVVVKGSGLVVEDFENLQDFSNLSHIYIGNDNTQKTQNLNQMDRKDVVNQYAMQNTVNVKTWKERLTEMAKKVPFIKAYLDRKNDVKALPESVATEKYYDGMSKDIDSMGETSEVKHMTQQDKFRESLQQGVNQEKINQVHQESGKTEQEKIAETDRSER